MSPRRGCLLYRRVEFNKAVPDIGQFLKLYDMGLLLLTDRTVLSNVAGRCCRRQFGNNSATLQDQRIRNGLPSTEVNWSYLAPATECFVCHPTCGSKKVFLV